MNTLDDGKNQSSGGNMSGFPPDNLSVTGQNRPGTPPNGFGNGTMPNGGDTPPNMGNGIVQNNGGQSGSMSNQNLNQIISNYGTLIFNGNYFKIYKIS